jgi:hypothetical protein
MPDDNAHNTMVNRIIAQLTGDRDSTAKAALESIVAGRDTLHIARTILYAEFGTDIVTPALTVELAKAMLQVHSAKLIADQLDAAGDALASAGCSIDRIADATAPPDFSAVAESITAVAEELDGLRSNAWQAWSEYKKRLDGDES